MFFKSAESEFHKYGPKTEKEQGPKVLVPSSGDVEISMHGRKEWAKMLDVRQWCHHLAKVCRSKFFSVGWVASEAFPDVAGNRIEP